MNANAVLEEIIEIEKPVTVKKTGAIKHLDDPLTKNFKISPFKEVDKAMYKAYKRTIRQMRKEGYTGR